MIRLQTPTFLLVIAIGHVVAQSGGLIASFLDFAGGAGQIPASTGDSGFDSGFPPDPAFPDPAFPDTGFPPDPAFPDPAFPDTGFPDSGPDTPGAPTDQVFKPGTDNPSFEVHGPLEKDIPSPAADKNPIKLDFHFLPNIPKGEKATKPQSTPVELPTDPAITGMDTTKPGAPDVVKPKPRPPWVKPIKEPPGHAAMGMPGGPLGVIGDPQTLDPSAIVPPVDTDPFPPEVKPGTSVFSIPTPKEPHIIIHIDHGGAHMSVGPETPPAKPVPPVVKPEPVVPVTIPPKTTEAPIIQAALLSPEDAVFLAGQGIQVDLGTSGSHLVPASPVDVPPSDVPSEWMQLFPKGKGKGKGKGKPKPAKKPKHTAVAPLTDAQQVLTQESLNNFGKNRGLSKKLRKNLKQANQKHRQNMKPGQQQIDPWQSTGQQQIRGRGNQKAQGKGRVGGMVMKMVPRGQSRPFVEYLVAEPIKFGARATPAGRTRRSIRNRRQGRMGRGRRPRPKTTKHGGGRIKPVKHPRKGGLIFPPVHASRGNRRLKQQTRGRGRGPKRVKHVRTRGPVKRGRKMPPGRKRGPVKRGRKMPPGRKRGPVKRGRKMPPGRKRGPVKRGRKMPPVRKPGPVVNIDPSVTDVATGNASVTKQMQDWAKSNTPTRIIETHSPTHGPVTRGRQVSKMPPGRQPGPIINTNTRVIDVATGNAPVTKQIHDWVNTNTPTQGTGPRRRPNSRRGPARKRPTMARQVSLEDVNLSGLLGTVTTTQSTTTTEKWVIENIESIPGFGDIHWTLPNEGPWRRK